MALCLVALLLAGCGPDVPLTVGSAAPRLDLALLDGEPWAPEPGPVLVNFWATWCMSCKVALPELRHLAETGAVDVVGLALDSDVDKVKGFAAQNGIAYPLALDDTAVLGQFGGLNIPHSVLLDADGRVLAIYRGTVRRQEVLDDLQQAGAS